MRRTLMLLWVFLGLSPTLVWLLEFTAATELFRQFCQWSATLVMGANPYWI